MHTYAVTYMALVCHPDVCTHACTRRCIGHMAVEELYAQIPHAVLFLSSLSRALYITVSSLAPVADT